MIIKSLYLQPISMSLSPEINFLSLKIPSKVPYNKNGDNRFLISNSLAIIKFSSQYPRSVLFLLKNIINHKFRS